MIAPRRIFCGKVFFSFPMPGRALPPTSFEERPPPFANALCPFLAGVLLLPTANRQRGQFLRAKLSFPAYFRFSFQRNDGEFNLRKSGSKLFFHHRRHCASFWEKQVSFLKNSGQEQFAKNALGLRKFKCSGAFQNPDGIEFFFPNETVQRRILRNLEKKTHLPNRFRRLGDTRSPKKLL